MCAQSLSCVQLFATPWTIAAMLLCQWDFSGKNTGVGCHALLQGIFPTQGYRIRIWVMGEEDDSYFSLKKHVFLINLWNV